MSGHDETSSLHTFESTDYGFVHPHDARGYLFLVDHLDVLVMLAYELDDEQPRVSVDELRSLVRDAIAAGLTVQQTYDARMSERKN
jgi:hypothetical protein